MTCKIETTHKVFIEGYSLRLLSEIVSIARVYLVDASLRRRHTDTLQYPVDVHAKEPGQGVYFQIEDARHHTNLLNLIDRLIALDD